MPPTASTDSVIGLIWINFFSSKERPHVRHTPFFFKMGAKCPSLCIMYITHLGGAPADQGPVRLHQVHLLRAGPVHESDVAFCLSHSSHSYWSMFSPYSFRSCRIAVAGPLCGRTTRRSAVRPRLRWRRRGRPLVTPPALPIHELIFLPGGSRIAWAHAVHKNR
jgi:hypothetical protein